MLRVGLSSKQAAHHAQRITPRSEGLAALKEAREQGGEDG
jgi:hypothetical protein